MYWRDKKDWRSYENAKIQIKRKEEVSLHNPHKGLFARSEVPNEKTGRGLLPGCGKWDKIPLTTRAVALRTKHWIKPKKIGRNEL
jgi:hypothetical protein